jgi:hypothetical protein
MRDPRQPRLHRLRPYFVGSSTVRSAPWRADNRQVFPRIQSWSTSIERQPAGSTTGPRVHWLGAS